MKDDRAYLLHIQECLADIDEFVGVSAAAKSTFLNDKKARGATLRALQTLSESANRLSHAVKARHPGIPWRKINGFRNVLVHDYLGLDYEQVWVVIEVELPRLRAAVDDLLRVP